MIVSELDLGRTISCPGCEAPIYIDGSKLFTTKTKTNIAFAVFAVCLWLFIVCYAIFIAFRFYSTKESNPATSSETTNSDIEQRDYAYENLALKRLKQTAFKKVQAVAQSDISTMLLTPNIKLIFPPYSDSSVSHVGKKDGSDMFIVVMTIKIPSEQIETILNCTIAHDSGKWFVLSSNYDN